MLKKKWIFRNFYTGRSPEELSGERIFSEIIQKLLDFLWIAL